MGDLGPLKRNFLGDKVNYSASTTDPEEDDRPFVQRESQLRNGYWTPYLFFLLFLAGSIIQLSHGVPWLRPTIMGVLTLAATITWIPARKYQKGTSVGISLLVVLILLAVVALLLASN